jgi:hypothetical protein
MNERSRRNWVILALLSYSLAATLSLGLKAMQSPLTAPAQTAEMQLQGGAENDEGSVAPDADEDTTAACVLRDCPSMKEEPTLVLAEVPQSHESKAFVAPGEQTQPKSKE